MKEPLGPGQLPEILFLILAIITVLGAIVHEVNIFDWMYHETPSAQEKEPYGT